MAVDQFIKIGDIKGESVDSKHKDSIDVSSWNWGMHQSGTMHEGGGGGSGKVAVEDLSFTHYIDKSTPPLHLACCTGKHYDKAVLTVRKAGEKPVEYLKITMEEVLITRITNGGNKSDDRVSETVHLNFAGFKMEYTVQNKDGTPGATVEAAFDIAEHVKK